MFSSLVKPLAMLIEALIVWLRTSPREPRRFFELTRLTIVAADQIAFITYRPQTKERMKLHLEVMADQGDRDAKWLLENENIDEWLGMCQLKDGTILRVDHALEDMRAQAELADVPGLIRSRLGLGSATGGDNG